MKTIVILEHPPEYFFKDEGGKTHGLTVLVSYQEFADGSDEALTLSKTAYRPIPLQISLYYENEMRVEEGDQQILSLIGDPPVLSWDNREIVIKFRISKVSRRKDGQRFRVLIEPAFEDEEAHLNEEIEGAFTEPITVLSKRKLDVVPAKPVNRNKARKRIHSNMDDMVVPMEVVAPRPKGNAVAEGQSALAPVGDQRLLLNKVDRLSDTISSLSKAVNKVYSLCVQNNNKIAMLENRLSSIQDLVAPSPMHRHKFMYDDLGLVVDEFASSETGSVTHAKTPKSVAVGGSPAVPKAVPGPAVAAFPGILPLLTRIESDSGHSLSIP